MKQWNHQRRDIMLIISKNNNARNTAINLNYKRTEQNNTEQWIQRGIQTYNLSKHAEEYKTMDPEKEEKFRNGKKNTVEIRVKMH